MPMTGRPQPLILSGLSHDIHAAAVRWALQRSGLQPLWATTLADPALAPLSLHADARAGVRATGGIDATHASSVWFRRPRAPRALPGLGEADREFVLDEWRRMIENVHLFGATGGAFWVNRADRGLAAEHKLLQLQAAHRCGLRFPDTLVSTDPDEIRAFHRRHGRVVYKPFLAHSWRDREGRIHSSYARTVDADALRHDASLRLCPGIYQAQVRKRCDLRVTAIGERLFTARIDSPEREDGVIDWRSASLGGNGRFRPWSLPAAWEDGLRRFMRDLGLSFGCIDLVADEDDQLHLLEINQAGQFLFVEDATPELPLLRAMAALLADARDDYAIDRIPPLSYAEFKASPECAAWRADVDAEPLPDDGRIPGVSDE